MKRVRSVHLLLLVVSLFLAGTACSQGSGDREPATTHQSTSDSSATGLRPEDRPIQWVDSGVIDLDSTDGTFVRGIAETDDLLLATHNHSIIPPGYLKAVNDVRPVFKIYSNDRQPEVSPKPIYLVAVPFPESFTKNSASSAPRASSEIGRAAICYSVNPARFGFEPRAFFQYEKSGKTPPTNQRGPLNQPAIDVFGDWRLTDYIIPTKEQSEACAAAGIPRPSSKAGTKPNPGWPNASQ